jgi:hypothetical protein
MMAFYRAHIRSGFWYLDVNRSKPENESKPSDLLSLIQIWISSGNPFVYIGFQLVDLLYQ